VSFAVAEVKPFEPVTVTFSTTVSSLGAPSCPTTGEMLAAVKAALASNLHLKLQRRDWFDTDHAPLKFIAA
jgi:hypothetical protein